MERIVLPVHYREFDSAIRRNSGRSKITPAGFLLLVLAKYELKDEQGYRYTDKIQFYVMDLTAIMDADEQERKRSMRKTGNRAGESTIWA